MEQATSSVRTPDSRGDSPPVPKVVLFTDAFPVRSETFIRGELRELLAQGSSVRVESSVRPSQPADETAFDIDVNYLVDDRLGGRLLDAVWLVARHPLRCLVDLANRRRWRREEAAWPLRRLAPAARRLARESGPPPHLHVHFAAVAALNALRLARLLGLRFSLTAHAYDIFQSPHNLREKLRAADLVTSGCDYNVAYLRELVGSDRAERVQRVVMGIDGERFRRDVQPPGTGRLLAVGRLVEKKGFADLLDALARLPRPDLVEGLRIVGDGPLRGELEAQIGRLGLEDRVELAGWRDRDQIRAELERADLLVMPCVVARDGDRDSMPVVVKEAMAMEVPVIGTDEVGLPELIRSQWGRLVPPHDPDVLARAIDELLALPAQERARMGAAGRAHVLEHCDVHRETRRLLELLDRYA